LLIDFLLTGYTHKKIDKYITGSSPNNKFCIDGKCNGNEIYRYFQMREEIQKTSKQSNRQNIYRGSKYTMFKIVLCIHAIRG
jgi:hypothetical protein